MYLETRLPLTTRRAHRLGEMRLVTYVHSDAQLILRT